LPGVNDEQHFIFKRVLYGFVLKGMKYKNEFSMVNGEVFLRNSNRVRRWQKNATGYFHASQAGHE
jgi:hypothetical protein